MKKTIVLITSSFPYGNGEQFLEGEIPYLSRTFEKIVIVPHRIAGQARTLPSNVVVDAKYSEKLKSETALIKTFKTLCGWACRGFPFRGAFPEWKSLFLAIYYSDCAEKYFNKIAGNFIERKQRVLFYSYWFSPAVIGLVAVKNNFENDAVIVVTRAHGSDLYESVRRIKEFPFRRKIINSIDRIYSVSENGAIYLKNKYDASNVRVARLGSFNNALPNFKKKNSIVRVCSCSFIYAIKRVDRIFDVVQRFACLNPQSQVEWVHIGDGPLKKAVEEKIRNGQLENLTCVLKGQMNNQEVLSYYAENYIDCFINLSSSEGIPVSMMEVMAFGVPILATDVGGVGEIVRSNAGVLVDVEESIDSVAELLSEVISSPGVRRPAARRVWEEDYNASKNYADFSKDLVEILES